MSPRPYRLGRREATVELTRARIVAAARELLTAESGATAYTIDTIAEHAGVARMTVYYQFGSKRGLLEALYDELAASGLVGALRTAYARKDPIEALDGLARAFCGFWASDQVVIRRLRGLAAVDQEIEQSIFARDERRREGLRLIVGRLAKQHRIPHSIDETVTVLQALSSFELFDALTQRGRKLDSDVPGIVMRLMHADLGLPPPPKLKRMRAGRHPRR